MPPKPQQAHAKAKESKAGGTVTPAVDITYKIQAVSITVRGAICEKEVRYGGAGRPQCG